MVCYEADRRHHVTPKLNKNKIYFDSHSRNKGIKQSQPYMDCKFKKYIYG